MADGGFLVTGTIGLHARPRRLVSVSTDPKAVLAEAWAKALRDAGIIWDREHRIENGTPSDSGYVLAEVTSATVRHASRPRSTPGASTSAPSCCCAGRPAGASTAGEELTAHVAEVTGIPDGAHLVDGSGLSHEDRVTPVTFISYLAKFPSTPAGKNFPMLLPANGEGTLVHLKSGLPAPGVVHAKTGTLSNVSTLVGYLGRPDGVMLISLMYNGGRVHTAKRQQWKLFRLLGADGVVIPSDSTTTDDEPEQLGGEDGPLVAPGRTQPEHPPPRSGQQRADHVRRVVHSQVDSRKGDRQAQRDGAAQQRAPRARRVVQCRAASTAASPKTSGASIAWP